MITHVYLLFDWKTGLYKIGLSNNITRRMGQIALARDCDLRLVNMIGFQSRHRAFLCERILHEWFEEKRRDGEWFRLMPADVVSIRYCFGLMRVMNADTTEAEAWRALVHTQTSGARPR